MRMSEHSFISWDGTELFYRAWMPEKPAGRALVLFHRGHEHSARWQETVDRLKLDGFAVFAWDQRGHGRSPGPRGSAENLAAVIHDADAFARHLVATYGIPLQEMAVVAHSVGAVIAAAWVHDYAPPIRCLVLGAPAFRVKLYVPFAVPLLRLKQRLFGPGYVKSYVKSNMLTHDPDQARAYQADRRIFRQIAVNILLDLYDTSTRLIKDAGAIVAPTLMLGAGADWVVSLKAQTQFFQGLSSTAKRFQLLPGFYHAIFHEKDRAQAVDGIRSWILECFGSDAAQPDLTKADRSGYTRDEYERLRAPGSMHWHLVRGGMKTFGPLSLGVALGWHYGFDSGVMLDYIYRNKPRGKTLLGRMIDRNYLNAIGWRGIRQRKIHLEAVLHEAVSTQRAAGRPVHITDVASGPGRYVLQTMKAFPEAEVTATLRDYKEENLMAARRLAKRYGLTERTTIVQGDAFDRKSLSKVKPRPTIGIVSGLFELFPDNAPVVQCLHGLADAIRPGDYLIYTCQPWHPQMEFIARVLTNREGKPWVMRRRTQAEMDALVREAGFEKIRQEIDPWGIFTVSLAQRVAAAK